jgi:hypothetical protein
VTSGEWRRDGKWKSVRVKEFKRSKASPGRHIAERQDARVEILSPAAAGERMTTDFFAVK